MASKMTRMTIGQVAKASSVGIETIRFYEKEGLIEEPARRPSGYRAYGDGWTSPSLVDTAEALNES